MKPITEYRKPKPVTLDGGEHRKPITEYRKPSGRMDNLRRHQDYNIDTPFRWFLYYLTIQHGDNCNLINIAEENAF